MGNFQQIVYLTQEDYASLVDNGSLTKNNKTIIYNPNNLYVTPENTFAITHNLVTGTKFYITGSVFDTSNTDDDSFNTNIYATTTTGELSALQYSFNINQVEKASIRYNNTNESLDFIFN